MKYSLRWLSELTVLPEWIQPQPIIDLLNQKGIEVESFHEEKLDHIVIGKILKQQSHPQADRLKICHVQVSSSENLSIVCGANNQKEGDNVAVCLEGSTLPSGLKIKKQKLRGEVSQGMLASSSELELSSESEGILILPQDAPLGERVDEYLNIRDVILDITIPPNRPDLLGHVGLARELSLFMEQPMCIEGLFHPKQFSYALQKWKWPSKKILKSKKTNFIPQKIHSPLTASHKESLKIHIQDSKFCPYYAGQIVENVQIAESPFWLKNRLESLGISSINNVVDVTAWVLLEWGQPLHAFDREQISGDIHVQKGNPKDSILTLSDEKIQLQGDELMIYDSQRPLAIAGVIGGKLSSVSTQTKNIFIESAVFNPYSVRLTARKLNLQTTAAFYFSRGAFCENSLFALQRACSLMEQLAGGQTLTPHFEAGSSSSSSKKISITSHYLEERLGYAVSSSEFLDGMEKMNNQVKKRSSYLEVEPPFYRRDLCIKEDLVEEWARIKSYDKVPERLPSLSSIPLKQEKILGMLEKVKNLAQRSGCYQAINYNFLNQEFQNSFLNKQDSTKDSLVQIQNPLTSDANVLRQSLIPGLFNNAVLNMRHGESLGRLFEQGVTFFKEGNSFKEQQYLSFMFWGKPKNIWNTLKPHSLFFDLKSSIEAILKNLGYRAEWGSWNAVYPFIDAHQNLSIQVNGQNIGFIGALNVEWEEKYKIKEEVVCSEINLSDLLSLSSQPFRFQTPPVLPVVSRDLSLLIPHDQKIGDILYFMQKNAPSLCKKISVLDYYEGKELEQGYRSVSFRLLLQGIEKTLSEKQINRCQSQITEPVFKKYPVKYREK